MHGAANPRAADDGVERIPLSSAWLERLRREWRGEGERYWLTRFVLLRWLGLVYLAAFLVAANQVVPLIGTRGLTPLVRYAEAAERVHGSVWSLFWSSPSLFWLAPSDALLIGCAWLGVTLSAVVLAGYANALILLALWVLYASFVHAGQVWYGYGWEIQLLETGLLACFLCPLWDARPFPRRPPPVPVIWLFRWLTVRILWGAGLIKLRGDACWKDLSCLYYHYQTQPIPNPLSRTLHFAPRWFHQAGVLFNHLVELVAPCFAFGPRHARRVAGVLFVVFQLFLIASGNLSFLNWLTIVPALACFDDSFWSRVLPRRLVERAERAARDAEESAGGRRATLGVVLVVAVLSVFPVANLLSSEQAMNRGYNPLDFVNTYGAFGTVGTERREIVFEGTDDAELTPRTRWRAYEFKCKPGDPARAPCVISPYHHRLDWQIWFAAMTTPGGAPWTVHFVWKLLHADPDVLALLASSPFGARPPKYVRAVLYEYEFASDREKGWWVRESLGVWLPPLSKDDPELAAFLRARGWLAQ